MNEETLKAIEEMAYQLFTPAEIAISLEMEEDEFVSSLKDRYSDVHRSFYRGYFRQLGEVRSYTIKAAHNGSNPAQMELLKLIGDIQRQIQHG